MLGCALKNKWPVFAYARVSTREQNGPDTVSLAAQHKAIKTWCDSKHLTIVQRVNETHSAFKPLTSTKSPLTRLAQDAGDSVIRQKRHLPNGKNVRENKKNAKMQKSATSGKVGALIAVYCFDRFSRNCVSF